jgi:hypothetical protein
VYTESSVGVTAVFSTWVFVVTINISGVWTVLSVTQVQYTFVIALCKRNWSKYARSSRAAISGTCIVVVTNNWFVEASSRTAAINSTWVVVVTVLCSVDTSFNWVATVISTYIVVITASLNIAAFSGILITAVISTCVFVVTVNVYTEESFSLSTFKDYTFVGIFVVLLVHVDWFEETSKDRIARFDGTWVLVITYDSFMFNFSGLRITPILGTCIVVVTFDWSVDTSSRWVARVNGTWVAVVTVDFFVNTSLCRVTSIFSTSVTILAGNCSVDTISSCNIARVCGTCIVIITVLFGEDAFSI